MLGELSLNRCFIDEIDVNSNYSHTFDPDILRPFIPVENDVLDGCSKYKNPYEYSETVACDKRIFDLTYHKESRVIEVRTLIRKSYCTL